eukprot:TRINITY_DN1803_c0_g1_i1.p1 TRINITY_DN1803_c0_g1~~TRINITY_DN1803_c0_g1_i1.p1  ORF type:complete len:206 (-),score=37.94 TRINITY_DN1803_c0_g1_i1:103-684(-)
MSAFSVVCVVLAACCAFNILASVSSAPVPHFIMYQADKTTVEVDTYFVDSCQAGQNRYYLCESSNNTIVTGGGCDDQCNNCTSTTSFPVGLNPDGLSRWECVDEVPPISDDFAVGESYTTQGCKGEPAQITTYDHFCESTGSTSISFHCTKGSVFFDNCSDNACKNCTSYPIPSMCNKESGNMWNMMTCGFKG